MYIILKSRIIIYNQQFKILMTSPGISTIISVNVITYSIILMLKRSLTIKTRNTLPIHFIQIFYCQKGYIFASMSFTTCIWLCRLVIFKPNWVIVIIWLWESAHGNSLILIITLHCVKHIPWWEILHCLICYISL